MFSKDNTDFLNILHKQHESHLEMIKQFTEMGKNLAALSKALTPKTKEDILVLQPYEKNFHDEGYTFNSLYIGDAAAADNAKLIVTISGVTFTITLIAGENEVNLPDGATYKVTTTSGNPVTALLTRYNTLR